jgi:hypothetical protein
MNKRKKPFKYRHAFDDLYHNVTGSLLHFVTTSATEEDHWIRRKLRNHLRITEE